MPRLTLRYLSYWGIAIAWAAGCAEYEAPSVGGGAASSAEGGAPDETGGKAAGGNFSNGGSKAGSAVSEGGKGASGASSNTGGSVGGAEGGDSSVAPGGMPGMAGADAGSAGEPAAGCQTPADCDDHNVCTDDSCGEDGACSYVNNAANCEDDADDCTDDICVDGACTHPANSAPCEDDDDACTDDVCAGDICTHKSNNTCQCQKAADCNDNNPCTTDKCSGNQCVYSNNTLGCSNDDNPCTDDVCLDGVCQHQNNTDSCSDDGNACTGDVCAAGQCTHPNVLGCCSGDGDCYDGNVCTDESCVDSKCVYTNNTGPCASDASPCTKDSCDAGQCTHPNNGVCAGSDDVIILANRNGKYIILNGSNLDYTGNSAGTAEVFTKVGEDGTKFKLRSKTNGMYVTLGAGDQLVASADVAGGMLFDAPSCGAQPWVGLNATGDTNGGAWAAADDGGHVVSRSANCGAASATSWEKFQLISVTIPCAAPADCNDGNVCTDETCPAGFCAFADHAGGCADDASSCTDDVCSTGTCTHPGNGSCMGPLVTIQANRNAKFVLLNASYLEYTAASAATAEKFELVDQVGTQFKLRASNSMFVTLDGATDNLTANATFAGAMLFNAPVCDANVGLNATADDDTEKYVAADAANRLIARSAGCGLGNPDAWEKFTLVPQ